MTRVTVGLSTCGIAAGAEDTYRALETTLAGLADAPELLRTGCVGMCYQEPLVEISNGDGERYLYGHISPDKVGRLVDEHLGQGAPVADWLNSTAPLTWHAVPWQTRSRNFPTGFSRNCA
jgi:NADH-quinone oxidoreductase subunit F